MLCATLLPAGSCVALAAAHALIFLYKLARQRELMTPASAYGEALVAFARADRLSEGREALAAMGIRVAPMTAAIAERGASLRAAQGTLRLPDAIVLATAVELDGELMTYDERLAKLAARQRGG